MSTIDTGMIDTGMIKGGSIDGGTDRSALVHRVVDSPVGPVTLLGVAGTLTGIRLSGDRRPAPTPGRSSTTDFAVAAGQLGEYFAGTRTVFDLPLRLVADPFTLAVWDLVRRIPFGEVRSYGRIATDLGRPGLARAVGRANGRNPFAIVVPCHRVVGGDGALTGYAAGLETKRWLLDHERPPLVR